MCLYPKLIKNPKYKVTKKNGGNVPQITDPRTAWVPIGCQKCMECRKQRGRQWSVRLQEEIRTNKKGTFVTLTFNTKSLLELRNALKKDGLTGYALENEIATLAVRRFLERWRKKYGVSVKHWLVTELGHANTEHIHLHGIIFTNEKDDIKKIWTYGYSWIGDYVNERTINYIIKYTTKQDLKHKEYNPKILTSPGIGAAYTERLDATLNKYKKGATRETYRTRQGIKLNLPVYYRNKIYSEEERERLWIEKLDKEERWVDGTRVCIKNGNENYIKILELARGKNQRLGYGNDKVNWNQKAYENAQRAMKFEKRIADWIEKDNEEQEEIKAGKIIRYTNHKKPSFGVGTPETSGQPAHASKLKDK